MPHYLYVETSPFLSFFDPCLTASPISDRSPEDPTSDLDDESTMSEDLIVEVSASASQSNTPLNNDDEENLTPPTHTKKQKKSQSAHSIEYQKVQILQQMLLFWQVEAGLRQIVTLLLEHM